MQPLRPGLGILPGLGQRIVAVAGFLLVVALLEADHAAGAYIDGGVDGKAHAAPPSKSAVRKFSSSLKPVAAERSGWNCAPITRPRWTTAANGSPYVLDATQFSVTGAAKLCTK